MNQIILLQRDEYLTRISKIRLGLEAAGADAALISDNANLFYITGRVFTGYAYIPLKGSELFFVRRPVNLQGDGVVYARKLDEMAESIGLNAPANLGLELDLLSYTAASRLKKLFATSAIVNISSTLKSVRSVKTAEEIKLLKFSGAKHERVYRRIPHLFHEGMTDLELQVEIERVSRLEGCLGQFRISGDSMEIFMGSVLTGENADTPTPYDFAMGGEGLNPSLPVGCNGSVIKPGNSVMVDMNGDFTGYMTDMTRTFRMGEIDSLAAKAHQCSIDICNRIAELAKPGVEAKSLYEEAERIVSQQGLHKYFMGHTQKAGFIGHGVGIEINELPVIAPRSRDIVTNNNVIALEPKFVIPHTGAVGIENTYVVTDSGLECLTNAPEEMVNLI